MEASQKNQRQETCLAEDEDNEMRSSDRMSAQPTVDGKYQCRYCGSIFDTLEAHDAHHRQIHGQYSEYLTTANQS